MLYKILKFFKMFKCINLDAILVVSFWLVQATVCCEIFLNVAEGMV